MGRAWERLAGAAVRALHWTFPGACAAVLFVALSFTPSLLPRSAVLQGVLAGINGAIGYAVGVGLAWLWREFADRGPREPSTRTWRVFAVVAAVLLLVAVLLSEHWQSQLRQMMGVAAPSAWRFLVIPAVTVAVFALLVGAGRALRVVYHRLAAWLERLMGRRAARATGWLVVTTSAVLVLSGVVLDGVIRAIDSSFALADQAVPLDVAPPDQPTRSGSEASLVRWEDLGRQGRRFVTGGPTAEQIGDLVGADAEEPVRIFAGTSSEPDVEARAQLAVADLERAGGFDRAYLLVANTTGSGFLEPSAVDSFEYLTRGDSAIVSMQYSHLPSVVSFAVDQQVARNAGRGLFDAVSPRWLTQPADDRPELYVFGESLGSFGGETAFSGENDLANRTAGALFVGAPSFNVLFREFTEDRDPGSPEIEPRYRDGRIVRFSNDATEPAPPVGEPWAGPHVLYLMHPSDPIVWWHPDLIWNRPDWLSEPRGRDVLPAMHWIPVVTFWQISADMAMGLEVDSGHGHVYVGDHVDGWVQVLEPEGWTAEQTLELRELMLHR